jgi:hypothetical protein
MKKFLAEREKEGRGSYSAKDIPALASEVLKT